MNMQDCYHMLYNVKSVVENRIVVGYTETVENISTKNSGTCCYKSPKTKISIFLYWDKKCCHRLTNHWSDVVKCFDKSVFNSR